VGKAFGMFAPDVFTTNIKARQLEKTGLQYAALREAAMKDTAGGAESS
jgi:hypothetical protein